VILTESGEIGVHVNDRVYVLRPSLYAMTQLGDPRAIVETYAEIMAYQHTPALKWTQFKLALSVLHVCGQDDLTDVFGYVNEQGKYVKKLAEFDDVVVLAQSLMRHGVVGAQKPLPSSAERGQTYAEAFDAAEYVSSAIAHLGMTEREAWESTMTSLAGAFRAKFPPTESDAPGAKAPTREEHEATEAWFDEVDKRRKRRVAIH